MYSSAIPPGIPASSNTSSNVSESLQTSSLRVEDSLSFFGVNNREQQNVIPTLDSIVSLLKSYGLAAPNYTQQGTKLIGTGATGTAQQGYSTSISNDTIAIGGIIDNDAIGATWIFTRTNNIWTQQGSKLIGSDAIGQGYQGVSVALKGNTLIVGGYTDDTNTGASWIFTRTDGVWTQQGPKLIASDAIGLANQGFSVAISEDENTVAIGGPQDNGGIGAVWIFTRTSGVWTQTNKIIGTGYIGNANQGSSVSISNGTLAVGGLLDNSGIGAVWIFVYTITNNWSQQTKIIGTGATEPAQQGYSIALKDNTLVVGGPYDNASIGATWVFTRTGSTWSQQGQKLVGTGYIGTPNQGSGIAVTKDILVTSGGLDNGGIGAGWVFTRTNGIWTQLGPKFVGNGYVGLSYQGNAYSEISISEDGTTITMGGADDDSGVGATWVFINY